MQLLLFISRRPPPRRRGSCWSAFPSSSFEASVTGSPGWTVRNMRGSQWPGGRLLLASLSAPRSPCLPASTEPSLLRVHQSEPTHSSSSADSCLRRPSGAVGNIIVKCYWWQQLWFVFCKIYTPGVVSLNQLLVDCGTTPRRQSGECTGFCMFIRVIYTMLPPHGHWLILP